MVKASVVYQVSISRLSSDVDHADLSDLSLNIIDKTDFNKPTEREAFWIYKLNTFIPKGLNQ